ncbi:MAG: DUF930 domain-containing protein [Rhizobiaceae bacterium]|nr:DUF930 domain-containing protein [Rhizobiaceae bacterium]
MDATKNSRFMAGWGLPASVVVHLFALILVIFGLPVDLLQTEEQQAIDVSLVPPPAQEQKAQAEPPPPPPPPAEPPEKPKQTEAQSAPPQGTETPQQTPSDPIINPVFQFGEEDSGPRESLDGNAAEEGSETAEPTEQPAETENTAQEEQETATEQRADDAPETVEQASSEAAQSEADRESEEKSAEAQSILSASRSNDQASLVEEPAKPAEKPSEKPEPPEKPKPKAEKQAPGKATKLQKATTLYSRAVTRNPAAMTAMRNMPRDIRAGRLCVTELREQLLNAWPPYAPDLLPTERLKSGTVLDGSGAAFRQAGEWYELNFRCEVDKDAMRVVSFAFSVGDRLSQSERMRRGLPLQ